MGNSKTKPEVEKTNNNIGLVNLEENNIALLGPVEIALIILLVFSIGFLLRYCQKRCKKSTVRSVQEGLSRNNQENLSNMSRTVSVPMPMPTNSVGVPLPIAAFLFPNLSEVLLQTWNNLFAKVKSLVTTAATAPMQVVQPSTNTSLGL